MLHYGEGYHAWEVSPEDYSQVLKVGHWNRIILNRDSCKSRSKVALCQLDHLLPHRLFHQSYPSTAYWPRLCRQGAGRQEHPRIYCHALRRLPTGSDRQNRYLHSHPRLCRIRRRRIKFSASLS